MSKSDQLNDLINALYRCVSGENSQQRNWDLFLSLFHSQARMMVLTVEGELNVYTPSQFKDSFIDRVGDDNFGEFETEGSRFVDNSMGTVWSKYSAKGYINGEPVDYEGYNSIQAIYFRNEWKILNMFWERPIDI